MTVLVELTRVLCTCNETSLGPSSCTMYRRTYRLLPSLSRTHLMVGVVNYCGCGPLFNYTVINLKCMRLVVIKSSFKIRSPISSVPLRETALIN